MQKISFKNTRGLNLVGNRWQASSDALIILIHGSESNRFARGIFEKVATELQKENYNALAFDFSGHGESDDAIVSLQTFVDDLNSTITYAKHQGFKRIALFGHSIGAYAALKCYSSEIKTMFFIGALTGPVHWKLEEVCTPEQLKEAHEKGQISCSVNDGLRETVILDAHILDDLAAINQNELLKNIRCPVLIIHGDTGFEETTFLELSKAALNLLPKESELKIIKGANHLFTNHISEVATLAKKWYMLHFSIK